MHKVAKKKQKQKLDNNQTITNAKDRFDSQFNNNHFSHHAADINNLEQHFYDLFFRV